MSQPVRIKTSGDLPEAVRRNLGIGRFRAKVLGRPDGEIVARATQDIGEVMIKLTYIRGERARSLELSEGELRRILLMARDVRRMTGQKSQEEYEEAWLEED